MTCLSGLSGSVSMDILTSQRAMEDLWGATVITIPCLAAAQVKTPGKAGPLLVGWEEHGCSPGLAWLSQAPVEFLSMSVTLHLSLLT